MSRIKECETGCVNLYGGEIRHHPDCVFYPESMSEAYAHLEAQLRTRDEQLAVARECLREKALRGHKLAAAALARIEQIESEGEK